MLQTGTAKGVLLGLLLGDAFPADPGALHGSGTLPGTASGQLACYTVEGLIRADVRGALRGTGSLPEIVWHAYARWAGRRGLLRAGLRLESGWLARVPVLGADRGAAIGVAEALRSADPAQAPGHPQIVVRGLPVGLYATTVESAIGLGQSIGRLTHRGAAVDTAAAGSALIAGLSQGMSVTEVVERLHDHPMGPVLSHAVSAAPTSAHGGSAETVPASSVTAASSLARAVRAVAAAPDALTAFRLAAPHGRETAATAGALIGAAFGVEALPADLVSRPELATVAETLADDLVRQLTECPGGTEYSEPKEPAWLERYPGW